MTGAGWFKLMAKLCNEKSIIRVQLPAATGQFLWNSTERDVTAITPHKTVHATNATTGRANPIERKPSDRNEKRETG